MAEQNVQNADSKNKKGKGVLAAVIVVAVVVLAVIVCYFMGLFGGIDEAEAKSRALAEVPGATESDITYLAKEFDDGRMEYNVQIVYENRIYDISMAARNGNILSLETEYINNALQDDRRGQTDADKAADIGVDRAKQIALAEVSGASESNIVKAQLDNDDGRTVYEVEIVLDGTEYDFEIDASTGEIIANSSEPVND